jgi:hypothetical protein
MKSPGNGRHLAQPGFFLLLFLRLLLASSIRHLPTSLDIRLSLFGVQGNRVHFMMNIDLAVKDFTNGNFFGEEEYRWRHGYQQQSNEQ